MTTTNPQRIFMTGASGYIGSVIAEFAIAEGYHVTSLSRSEASDAKIRNLGAVPVRGDLSSHDVLTRESAKADIVINLADAWRDNLDKDYSVTLKIDNQVIDAIVEGLKGTGKPLIITSGSLVVAADPEHNETTESSPLWEKPINGRVECEKYALAQSDKGVRVSAIRLAPWVYGRGGSGVRLFMFLALKAGSVTYVGDEVYTTTVHVDDAARLYLLAAKNAKAGEAYNGTYETDVTIHQISDAMGKVLGLPVHSRSIEETAATSGEFLSRFLSTENRASNAKAIEELGWQPKETKILEEITAGSYVPIAANMKKPAA